jgi:putative oxidoreductase
MNTLSNLSALTGRIGLSAIFILSGIAKLGAGYAGTRGLHGSYGRA